LAWVHYRTWLWQLVVSMAIIYLHHACAQCYDESNTVIIAINTFHYLHNHKFFLKLNWFWNIIVCSLLVLWVLRLLFLNFQVILGSALRTFWTMDSLATPFLKMYPAQRLAITSYSERGVTMHGKGGFVCPPCSLSSVTLRGVPGGGLLILHVGKLVHSLLGCPLSATLPCITIPAHLYSL